MTRSCNLGTMTRWYARTFFAGFAALLLYVGCDDTTQVVTPAPTTGGAGGTGGGSTGGTGGTLSITVGSGGMAGATPTECDPACDDATEICSHGVCVPLSPCTDDNDCDNDTYCDPAVGCLPWNDAMPPHDEDCVQIIPPGVLAPAVMCEFSTPPLNDPFPGHVDVQGTPVVTTFDPVNNAPPSIAASVHRHRPQQLHRRARRDPRAQRAGLCAASKPRRRGRGWRLGGGLAGLVRFARGR